MALVQTQFGDEQVINALVALWNAGGALIVHLFTNNHAPTDTSVPGDFTAPTYTGYATQVAGSWSAATIVSSKGSTAAAPLLFTCTVNGALNNIYGYWVERSDATGSIWFAELWGTPVPVQNAGDALVLYLVYTNVTA